MPETAKSSQNHRVILFIDLVRFPVGELARKQRLDQAFVDHEEERGRHHRQSHRRDQEIPDPLVENLVLCSKRDQHERKLATLGQSECKREILTLFQTSDFADAEKEEEFGDQQAQRPVRRS